MHKIFLNKLKKSEWSSLSKVEKQVCVYMQTGIGVWRYRELLLVPALPIGVITEWRFVSKIHVVLQLFML